LHFEERLDVAGTEPEMAIHQGNPGDQPRTHLSGRDFLWKSCDHLLVATGTDPCETLMLGDGISDLGQIKVSAPANRCFRSPAIG
jgi:hypothetical protein